MSISNGRAVLFMAACCLIFVCLGYVEVCKDLTRRVNQPSEAEFWQVRNIALKMRDPVFEAQVAFDYDDYSGCRLTEQVTDADTWMASMTPQSEPMVAQASMLDFRSWFSRSDRNDRLTHDHKKYLATSQQFMMDYNTELTRLINEDEIVD